MSEGTFKKIGESEERMYGPRAVLACGFMPADQEAFMQLLETIHLTDVPVIFATGEDGDTNLGTLMAKTDQSGRNNESDLKRTVVLSGITEKELQATLSGYRGTGLPRPLWATLTPFTEEWSLTALIDELEKERRAMEKR